MGRGRALLVGWNGQTLGDVVYSVAGRSLLLGSLFIRLLPYVAPKWRLAALLHDAPEYVIGDMISPVKAAVGPGYTALDDRLEAAIHLRFGLPAKVPQKIKRQIKKADKISAWMEATQIAGFTEAEATKFFGQPNAALIEDLTILLRPPVETRTAYTARHAVLLEQCT